MNATEAPRDENPTKMVLLVVTDQTLAGRYAEWLAPRYLTKIAISEQAALGVLDDCMAVVLSYDLQNITPLEFLDRARTFGYNGKVALITDSRANADISGDEFDIVLSRPVSESALIETAEKLVRRFRYENDLERHLSLTKRRARWEAQMSNEELNSSQRYADLLAELNGLETEMDEILSDFESDDFSALFQGVVS